MGKFKKLYYELQMELDKLDSLRKNWIYFSMKRQALIETNATPAPEEMTVDDCYESLSQEPFTKAKLGRY